MIARFLKQCALNDTKTPFSRNFKEFPRIFYQRCIRIALRGPFGRTIFVSGRSKDRVFLPECSKSAFQCHFLASGFRWTSDLYILFRGPWTLGELILKGEKGVPRKDAHVRSLSKSLQLTPQQDKILQWTTRQTKTYHYI